MVQSLPGVTQLAHPDTRSAVIRRRMVRVLLALALLACGGVARLWAEYRLAHWSDAPAALRVVQRAARSRVFPPVRPRVRRFVLLVLDGIRANDAPKPRGAFARLDSGVPSYSKAGYHR